MSLRPFGLYCKAVFVFYLCPSSARVVATFPGTALFPLLCSVLRFFPPNALIQRKQIQYIQSHITIDRKVAVASGTISTVSHNTTKSLHEFQQVDQQM
jgi:hypothetical protein